MLWSNCRWGLLQVDTSHKEICLVGRLASEDARSSATHPTNPKNTAWCHTDRKCGLQQQKQGHVCTWLMHNQTRKKKSEKEGREEEGRGGEREKKKGGKWSLKYSTPLPLTNRVGMGTRPALYISKEREGEKEERERWQTVGEDLSHPVSMESSSAFSQWCHLFLTRTSPSPPSALSLHPSWALCVSHAHAHIPSLPTALTRRAVHDKIWGILFRTERSW